jgi:hypothetical protein
MCRPVSTRAGAVSGGTRIAGKVVNQRLAPAIAGAVTIANALEQDQTMSASPAQTARFVFTGLSPAGTRYRLQGEGFIESAYNQREQTSTAIVTGSEADSEHLIFRLTPQAFLTGRDTTKSGSSPQSHRYLGRQDQSTGVGLIHRITTARTDDLGVYEFICRRAITRFGVCHALV